MHPRKFASKAWSCNSLMAGAARVVDQSALPVGPTLAAHHEDLALQMQDLDTEQLEALIEDHVCLKLKGRNLCTSIF